MPSRKRPGNVASRSATAGPTSAGAPVHMLTIPLATATRFVAARSRPNLGENPGSKPPDDHSAPYPSDSSSAATSSVGSAAALQEPLHHTPNRPRSTKPRYRSPESAKSGRSSRVFATAGLPESVREALLGDLRGTTKPLPIG